MIYLSGFGGFYSCNGLSGKCSNGQWREDQSWEQTEESFNVFRRFYLFLISEVKFSFQTKEEQKGTKKQWAVFVCFVFLYMSFSLVPNSEIECSALRGEAAGEVFLAFLSYLWFYISLVYRNLVETLWENSHDEILPKAGAKSGFVAHSRHCE